MTNETSITTGCWRGRSCFVVGGGPSLRSFDFKLLDDRLTIGVNRAFEFFDPTILLALDARFYEWVMAGKYGDKAKWQFEIFKGVKVGIRVSRPHPVGVREIKSLGVKGPIVPVEEGIYHGNNSGYSAVALALALGANPVYVLGIDMRYDGDRSHHHDGHPELTPERELQRKCIGNFKALSMLPEAYRVRFVNLSWPEENFSAVAEFFYQVPFPKKQEPRPLNFKSSEALSGMI